MPPSVFNSAVTDPLLPSAETRTASSAASSAAAAMALEISVSRAEMSVMQTSELNRLWLSNVYLVKPCRRPGIGSCHEDRLMLERTVFALFAAALLTTPLKAMDCPVETRVEGTLEAKEE